MYHGIRVCKQKEDNAFFLACTSVSNLNTAVHVIHSPGAEHLLLHHPCRNVPENMK
jgi:hypothetical protein